MLSGTCRKMRKVKSMLEFYDVILLSEISVLTCIVTVVKTCQVNV